nr:hypothetical protein [Photobacterium damselae]
MATTRGVDCDRDIIVEAMVVLTAWIDSNLRVMGWSADSNWYIRGHNRFSRCLYDSEV